MQTNDDVVSELQRMIGAIKAALARGTFVGLRRAREHVRSGQIIEWLHTLGVDVAPLLSQSCAQTKMRVVEVLQKVGNAHSDADEFRSHGARDGLSLVAGLALDALAGLRDPGAESEQHTVRRRAPRHESAEAK